MFLIALTIRLAAILFWQFDGLYGQDSYAYFQQAFAIVDNIPKGLPPPKDFFWPNGYPLLIAIFMLIVGKVPLAGQLAALLSGALLAPLAYVLTKDLLTNSQSTNCSTNQRAGILAGLIIAVAGQPILSSIVVMADMPALFWATLSTWCVVRGSSQHNLRSVEGTPHSGPQQAVWFAAAGTTLALAIISRWIYILILPTLGSYTIFNMRKAKRLWLSPALAIVSGIIILGPQLWLSHNNRGGLLHAWLLGWQPVNFFQRQFENIDGHFSYQLPVGIFYAQPAGHPAYIFPLLGLAGIWGLWRLWQKKQGGVIILLLGWIASVYLFLGGIPYQNFRFGVTLYVPLVILTGAGISDLIRRRATTSLFPRTRVPLCLRPIVLFITVLSLLGMLGWAYPMLDNFLTIQNQSKNIARQVEQSLPPEATLLTFGLTLTFQHYTKLNTLELFYFDEISLDNLTTAQNPSYLLLDLPNIETQWLGKTPQINYQWLRKNTVLTKIDTFPPYVLFKVDRTSQDPDRDSID